MDQPWSAPFLQVKPLWPYFSLVYRYTLVFWVYTWAKSLTMWGWFPNNTGCRLGNSKWGIPGANQLAGGFHPQKNARKLGVILPFGRGQSEKMKPSRSSSISQFLRELVSDLSWLEEIEIYKQFNIRMSNTFNWWLDVGIYWDFSCISIELPLYLHLYMSKSYTSTYEYQ